MLLLALFALASTALASFRIAPAPDTIILVYPKGDVPLGSNVTLGTDGYGGFLDASNPVAMTWQTSVVLTYPNGTHVTHSLVYAGLLQCPDALSPTRDSAVSQWVVDTGSVGQTGTFVVSWNQTYGTFPDVQPANASSCARSVLSYQSWTLTTNFTVVVAPTATAATTLGLTTVTSALVPAPTGSVLVQNGARGRQVVWVVMSGVVGAVVLQLL